MSKKLEFEGSCSMNRGKYLMKRLISIYILRSGQNLYIEEVYVRVRDEIC